MKILIIGSGGMLGHVTTLFLKNIGHHVVDISKKRTINKNTLLIDVLEKDALSSELLSTFDVVINCAALLVNASEKDKPRAILMNSWFPHYLEENLLHTKTKIIQVSTDGVFFGDKAPYQENIYPDTKTFYGRTKALGEVVNTKDLTIRASFVGPDMHKEGEGLFHWFVQQKGVVKGYSKVMFNAVTNLEFANFVSYAIEKNISGLYHLRASESISKHCFLSKVKQQFRLNNVILKENDDIISDNTLANTRNEVGYICKSYNEMLSELEMWMRENKWAYPHYSFL